MLNPYPPAWVAATRLAQHQEASRRGGAIAVVAAVGMGFIGQLIRLEQTDPVYWLATDYLLRIACLLILALPPALRAQVYRSEWRDAHIVETVFWVLVMGLFLWVTHRIWPIFGWLIPIPPAGGYPELHGLLQLFDLTFGLALVAVEEELLWRRAMRIALSGLGDGPRMAAISALLFGAYHWWQGGAGFAAAAVFGGLAMQFYRRTGVLWPMILLHYCTDFAIFYAASSK
jgi:membrane protease YdiL (CAAX protease family)